MKLFGEVINQPSVEVVVIPRNGKEFVFKAAAVLDYEAFLALCPPPMPPEIVKPGGARSRDVEDKDYKDAVDLWATHKINWTFIQSLKATEGLEWDTISASDPSTWGNINTELLGAGFTPGEINRIFECVTIACGLNQRKIDEATKRFLAGPATRPVE